MPITFFVSLGNSSEVVVTHLSNGPLGLINIRPSSPYAGYPPLQQWTGTRGRGQTLAQGQMLDTFFPFLRIIEKNSNYKNTAALQESERFCAEDTAASGDDGFWVNAKL